MPSVQWFDNRPQLVETFEQAKQSRNVGVAYWLGHRAGWLVQHASAPMIGYHAELAPDVQYFRVDDGADLAVQVFANNQDEAAGLFQIWHYTQFGEVCGEFGCQQMSPWLLIGDQVSLREDMDGDQIGIAGHDEQGVWRVLPPDHPGAGE